MASALGVPANASRYFAAVVFALSSEAVQISTRPLTTLEAPLGSAETEVVAGVRVTADEVGSFALGVSGSVVFF